MFISQKFSPQIQRQKFSSFYYSAVQFISLLASDTMASIPSESVDAGKARLAMVVKQFNQGLNPTIQDIPTNHIMVSKAGDGIFGDVYFCLRADAMTFTDSNTTHSSNAKPDLITKLVAVKVVGSRYNNADLSRELEIMTAIQNQVHTLPVAQRFFQLLEWDTVAPYPQWIVTSTFPICWNLTGLTLSANGMPEEFLWLVYSQLHEALDFLHNTCDPPIAHGDLHQGNVIIGFPTPDRLGLPEVKLIDFGLSSFVKKGEKAGLYLLDRMNLDAKNFLYVLDNTIHPSKYTRWNETTCNEFIANGKPEGMTSMLYDFHHALNAELGRQAEVQVTFLQALWEQFGAFAKQWVSSIPDASKKQIQDVLLAVTKGKTDQKREKIEEIWQCYGEY